MIHSSVPLTRPDLGAPPPAEGSPEEEGPADALPTVLAPPETWPEGFDPDAGASWGAEEHGLPPMWSKFPNEPAVADGDRYANPHGYTVEPLELAQTTEEEREEYWQQVAQQDEMARFFQSKRLRRKYAQHRHIRGDEGVRPAIVPHRKFPDWPTFDFEAGVEKSSREGMEIARRQADEELRALRAWERGETDVEPGAGGADPAERLLQEFDPDEYVEPQLPDGSPLQEMETYRPNAFTENKIIAWKRERLEKSRRAWKQRQIALKEEEGSFLDPHAVDWRLQYSAFRGRLRTEYTYEELFNAATKYGEKPTFDDLNAIQGMPHFQGQIQDPALPTDIYDPEFPFYRSRDSIVDGFSVMQIHPMTDYDDLGDTSISFEDPYEAPFSGVDPMIYSVEAEGMLLVEDPEVTYPLVSDQTIVPVLVDEADEDGEDDEDKDIVTAGSDFIVDEENPEEDELVDVEPDDIDGFDDFGGDADGDAGGGPADEFD